MTHLTNLTYLTHLTFMNFLFVKKGAGKHLQAILTWHTPYSSGVGKDKP